MTAQPREGISLKREDITFTMVKPHAYGKWPEVLAAILSYEYKTAETGIEVPAEFTIEAIRAPVKIAKETAKEFYAQHRDRPFFLELVDMMTEGTVACMVVSGPDAINQYRQLLGPTNVQEARKNAPYSLRAKFGESGDGVPLSYNAAHGSDDPKSAKREIGFFFRMSEVSDRIARVLTYPQ
ncbi:MAG: nucleoside-diphosphate kinase [Candidatus Aenigmarchaeota archaeon]|nr:nucleoside-diphosphate kinase [Candidatus Aenigmarchaeota archaeon]